MDRRKTIENLATFAQDENGSILPLMAGMIVALVGMTALGVEVTSWYVAESALQRVTDGAAVQGMYAYKDSTETVENNRMNAALKRANAFAVKNGAVGSGDENAMSCNNAATTLGGYDVLATCTDGANLTAYMLDVSGSKRVRVDATEDLDNLLGSMFSSSTTVAASGTARMGGTTVSDEACILGLDPNSGEYGYMQSGTADVVLDNCTIRSNSNLNLVGAADATVLGAYAGQTINSGTTCPGSLVTSPTSGNCHANAGTKADPYSAQMTDEWAKANTGGTSYSQGGPPSGVFYDLTAGYYNSITVKRTTYMCGVYYVSGNVHFTSASAKVYMTSGCSGVTIVANGSIKVDGQATIDLTAPSTGNTKGIVFASKYTEKTNGSEAATENLQNYVQGGANATITGALYFPNASIRFAGNSTSGSSACTQIVAWTIRVTGTSGLGNNCTSAGTTVVADTGTGESATVMLAK